MNKPGYIAKMGWTWKIGKIGKLAAISMYGITHLKKLNCYENLFVGLVGLGVTMITGIPNGKTWNEDKLENFDIWKVRLQLQHVHHNCNSSYFSLIY